MYIYSRLPVSLSDNFVNGSVYSDSVNTETGSRMDDTKPGGASSV